MKSYIGWKVIRDHTGMQISQLIYSDDLLTKYALDLCNEKWTPMTGNVNFTPAKQNEMCLDRKVNSKYHLQVG